jgi:alkanesulfonate monooxygenase SsuD/methylene tetrahydromethanopterin reductase-like flavin-dependent oxidoreductase (luciferase family)
VEFGIFNSLYLPKHLREKNGPAAEHMRFMDEVNWTLAADKAGFKYTWATEHHFLDE